MTGVTGCKWRHQGPGHYSQIVAWSTFETGGCHEGRDLRSTRRLQGPLGSCRWPAGDHDLIIDLAEYRAGKQSLKFVVRAHGPCRLVLRRFEFDGRPIESGRRFDRSLGACRVSACPRRRSARLGRPDVSCSSTRGRQDDPQCRSRSVHGCTRRRVGRHLLGPRYVTDLDFSANCRAWRGTDLRAHRRRASLVVLFGNLMTSLR
jgi:hypothetical protein